MALSNIFREPRREITETVVGVVLLVVVLVPDYLFGQALHDYGVQHNKPDVSVPIGMFIGLFFGGCMILLLVLLHAVGEGVCNALERNGLQLRPRRRSR